MGVGGSDTFALDVLFKRLTGFVGLSRLLLGDAEEEQRRPPFPRWRVRVQEGDHRRCRGLKLAAGILDVSRALDGASPLRARARVGDCVVDGERLLHVAIVEQLIGEVQVEGNVEG